MTELNPELKNNLTGPTPESPAPAKSRWKGPVIAALLSLLVPGLGQLRNREPWKGFLAAVAFPSLTILAGYNRIFLSFKGMVGFIASRVFLLALVCIDAFRGARQGRESRKPFHDARFMFVVIGVLILACTIFPATDYFLRKFGYFRAFKVPSASMCPTICEGQRIVADMYAYLEKGPQKGDVILLDFHSAHGPLFIKRVVGVAGDIVSEKDGTIQVNGKPFWGLGLPQVCGKPKDGSKTEGNGPRFDAVVVPVSSYFVVGDNLPNSYDSRIPGFGLVTPDQIKGRPLHIYWSTEKSRIGCPVR